MKLKLPENNAAAAAVLASGVTLASLVIGTLAWLFGPAVIALAAVFGVAWVISFMVIDIYRWDRKKR